MGDTCNYLPHPADADRLHEAVPQNDLGGNMIEEFVFDLWCRDGRHGPFRLVAHRWPRLADLPMLGVEQAEEITRFRTQECYRFTSLGLALRA